MIFIPCRLKYSSCLSFKKISVSACCELFNMPFFIFHKYYSFCVPFLPFINIPDFLFNDSYSIYIYIVLLNFLPIFTYSVIVIMVWLEWLGLISISFTYDIMNVYCTIVYTFVEKEGFRWRYLVHIWRFTMFNGNK